MKKNIWIISQYASYVEARPIALSKILAEHGYSPVVITQSYHHGSKKYLYNEPVKFVQRSGVTWVYMKSSPAYKSYAARLMNMISFCMKLRKYEALIIKNTCRPDFIVSSFDNPFLPETGYSLAKRLGAKFITEIRDIWPLNLVEAYGVSKYNPFVLLVRFLEKRALKHSDSVITTMPFAYKYIEEVSGVPREKVFWLANGIDTEEYDKNMKSGAELPADLKHYLTENKCFVYAGSIVKGECVDYLIQAWEFLQDTDLHLAVIGDGAYKPCIEDLISKKCLKHIKTFPAVPRSLVGCALGCASYRVTTNVYKYGLSINKLNDYLYSGKPVIFACSAPNVVQDAGHFALPTCPPEVYAQKVREVSMLTDEQKADLAEKGRSIIKREYDYKVIGKKYIAMLESL